jgi:hypothetical protein
VGEPSTVPPATRSHLITLSASLHTSAMCVWYQPYCLWHITKLQVRTYTYSFLPLFSTFTCLLYSTLRYFSFSIHSLSICLPRPHFAALGDRPVSPEVTGSEFWCSFVNRTHISFFFIWMLLTIRRIVKSFLHRKKKTLAINDSNYIVCFRINLSNFRFDGVGDV